MTELVHYGVKGMKWGVRKKRTRKEEAARNQRKKTAERRRNLSNEELQQAVNRLQLERQLKSLTDADLQPGRAAVTRIMSESGQRVARTVIAGAALYGVKAVLTKQFNARDAATYLTPRPKK